MDRAHVSNLNGNPFLKLPPRPQQHVSAKEFYGVDLSLEYVTVRGSVRRGVREGRALVSNWSRPVFTSLPVLRISAPADPKPNPAARPHRAADPQLLTSLASCVWGRAGRPKSTMRGCSKRRKLPTRPPYVLAPLDGDRDA